jgi:hypothetical protein
MFCTSRQWRAVLLVITLLPAGSPPPVFGYALEGYSWLSGSTVNIRLSFTGPSTGILQDGFATFNGSAADALNLWNQQLQLIKFGWTTNLAGGLDGDGQNSAFFSNNAYGMSFGDALAITIYYHSGAVMKEADNLFNSAILWDSYRGPIQYNSKKKKYVYDLHRVALHEFGHTLGLTHPDEEGQTVIAIMNSHVSDLDHITDDDIAGITFLYIRPSSPVRCRLG